MQSYLSRVQSIFTDKKKCVFHNIFLRKDTKKEQLTSRWIAPNSISYYSASETSEIQRCPLE